LGATTIKIDMEIVLSLGSVFSFPKTRCIDPCIKVGCLSKLVVSKSRCASTPSTPLGNQPITQLRGTGHILVFTFQWSDCSRFGLRQFATAPTWALLYSVSGVLPDFLPLSMTVERSSVSGCFAADCLYSPPCYRTLVVTQATSALLHWLGSGDLTRCSRNSRTYSRCSGIQLHFCRGK